MSVAQDVGWQLDFLDNEKWLLFRTANLQTNRSGTKHYKKREILLVSLRVHKLEGYFNTEFLQGPQWTAIKQ